MKWKIEKKERIVDSSKTNPGFILQAKGV
jgi:hypothetical protein